MIDGLMDGWIDDWWVDGWMDGWMDVLIDWCIDWCIDCDQAEAAGGEAAGGEAERVCKRERRWTRDASAGGERHTAAHRRLHTQWQDHLWARPTDPAGHEPQEHLTSDSSDSQSTDRLWRLSDSLPSDVRDFSRWRCFSINQCRIINTLELQKPLYVTLFIVWVWVCVWESVCVCERVCVCVCVCVCFVLDLYLSV